MSDADALIRLYKIFSNKHWNSKFGHETVFTNFSKLIENLQPEQKKLIVELTERYTWITEGEYPMLLNAILEKIDKEKLNKIKRLILFPVFKPEHKDQTKSGNEMLYKFRAYRNLLDRIKDKQFVEIETYEKILSTELISEEGTEIFLLDDYLGSGETIKDTVTEILKNPLITTKKISVLAIASQKNAADYLTSMAIDLYTDKIYTRGITDYYQNPEKYDNIRTMQAIEYKINDNKYPFGYEESEALITLMRTPDNTFPIFWKEHRKGGIHYPAPFTRNE